MSSQRKPMNEALAKSLVFGAAEQKIEKRVENKDVVDFTPELPVEAPRVETTPPKLEEAQPVPVQEIKIAAKEKVISVVETKRFTMDIPKPLHAKFSVIAIHLDKDKSEIMLELLENFVKNNSNSAS